MPAALDAWRDGARRVTRAPAILFGMWALTLAATLPAAAVLGGAIASSLNHSVTADAVSEGVDYEWMREFSAGGGLPSTLQPTVVGFGAVLDSLSGIADRTPRPAAVVGIAAVYMAAWLFLAGGIIDRYARDRSTRSYGFFAACGVFFFRFLRLAVAQALVYGCLFGLVHPWLFEHRTAVGARLTMYAVFGLLIAVANLVFDYAKVRAVVEDRRSMLGALASAIGFVRRNGSAAATLYAVDALTFIAVVALYGAAAPSVGRGALVWLVVLFGQLFVAVRLWVKLLFWASETALFQMKLAHAGYVARPEPAWPDSPAAEAISGSG